MTVTPSAIGNNSVTPQGRFGDFGGCYSAEILMPLISELREGYFACRSDPDFQRELAALRNGFAGRPTPLTRAARLSETLGDCRIYLKREDLNHTGSHKLNNVLGQVLLARRMNKTRIIAETGAGMHGVATATACARFGMECVIYMGGHDMERQSVNVERMRLLGAGVRRVTSGSATLKDALNEALRDWVGNVPHTHYVIGSVCGPHPYPVMVRDFQSVIGFEARRQFMSAENRLPDILIACVGGGSNAIGFFHPFINSEVELVGAEAAGEGIASGRHAATLNAGTPGIIHGTLTRVLQDTEGQVRETSSISAGLDYPGVGPEHAWLHESGRARYEPVTDSEAVRAFRLLSRTEGIIPALESSHALACLEKLRTRGHLAGRLVGVCLSGRGDKDMMTVAGCPDRNDHP